jgi:Zn-dependent protease
VIPDWLPELAVAVVAAVLAITLHEAAHGYAALALGDDTAKRAGRISLNPIRHVDPVGTLLLPGVLLVSQLLTIGRVEAMFGWAKPVPVNIWNLRSPRWGMVGVAAAGPGMNFALAWFAGLAVHALVAWQGAAPEAALDMAMRFLALFILSNLVLALFNLLPVPPLDGGRILVGVLPMRAAMAVARLERAGLLLVVLALFVLPALVPGFDPLGFALRTLVAGAFEWVLLLSGHGGVGS